MYELKDNREGNKPLNPSLLCFSKRKIKLIMENFIKLVFCFIVYSFLGWVLESVVKTVAQKKFVNSGFLYGPFCPIYGFGAVIMLMFLQSFKNNIIVLFIIAFIVLSIWEYIVGWLLEKLFKTKYWDYSENKLNIHGRVCLMNSLFWGFLGVVFIHYIHPFIGGKIELIPQHILIYVTSIISVAIIVDLIVSIVKLNNIQPKLEKLNEISNTIKEKLEELKNIKDNTQISKENIQQIIDELKYNQTKIKRKLLRQSNRLKKAFPTMKSEAIEKLNEFLNQKIENRKKDRNK